MRKYLLLLWFLIGQGFLLYAQSPPGISSWQYWFDDNAAGTVTQSLVSSPFTDISLAVDASALPAGLHRLNARFGDDSLRYSPVSTSVFFHAGPVQVTGYEYWFNHDYAARQQSGLTPSATTTLNTNVAVNSLPFGLNTFSIRFSSGNSRFSSISTFPFYYDPGTVIVAYEYWHDDQYAAKVEVPVAATGLLDLSPAFAVPPGNPGMHTFHIRFRSNTGRWSPAASSLYYRHGGSAGQSDITAYEYWFDDNDAGHVTVPVTAQPACNILAQIGTPPLSPGLHRVHIRFLSGDSRSAVTSQMIFISGRAEVASNLVTGYSYWIDGDPQTLHSVSLPSPAGSIDILDSLALPYAGVGKHLLNIRFVDTLGLAGPVTSDSIQVTNCAPYSAGAITGNSGVCRGASGVVYSIPVIANATGYAWSVPPGAQIVSGFNTRSITVDFTANAVSGDIQVYGTNLCGNSAGSSLTVTVSSPHTPTISGPASVCAGTTGAVYSTQPGKSGYLWSVSGGGMIVSGAGTYRVTIDWGAAGSGTITAGYFESSGCFGSGTIAVTIRPLPPVSYSLPGQVISSGQSICADALTVVSVPVQGSQLSVQPGASAILVAGERIQLKAYSSFAGSQGVRVLPGGYLHAYITTTCQYCNSLAGAHFLAMKEEEATPAVPSGNSPGDGTLKVFPNPTPGKFRLELTGGASQIGSVEIYAPSGRRISTQPLKDVQQQEFSLEGNPPGLYLIRVIRGNAISAARVILNR
ncbi:MAG TPA: T9SS type A sorting domain-containing protein [Bacteroidales bacterium]|nr:T9SS type A sorting domain-containing protein [Bacteroidales bacterium]